MTDEDCNPDDLDDSAETSEDGFSIEWRMIRSAIPSSVSEEQTILISLPVATKLKISCTSASKRNYMLFERCEQYRKHGYSFTDSEIERWIESLWEEEGQEKEQRGAPDILAWCRQVDRVLGTGTPKEAAFTVAENFLHYIKSIELPFARVTEKDRSNAQWWANIGAEVLIQRYQYCLTQNARDDQVFTEFAIDEHLDDRQYAHEVLVTARTIIRAQTTGKKTIKANVQQICRFFRRDSNWNLRGATISRFLSRLEAHEIGVASGELDRS